MIITTLKGGIGNQMFQYAVGRKLADIHQTELILDISAFPQFDYEIIKKVPIYHDALKHFGPQWLVDRVIPDVALRNYNLNNFNIRIDGITKNPEVYHFYKFHERTEHHYDEELFKLPNDSHIDGHWEVAKYVDDILPQLRYDFTLTKPIKNNPYENDFKYRTTIALHVRRGDLILNPYDPKIPCNLDYYKNAIEYMESIVKQPVFILFSDDIKWCHDNIIPLTGDYSDAIYSATRFKNYQDLYLMSKCHHHIIANSTFSWWGAKLATNPNQIVITPSNWFKSKYPNELIDTNWIVI